MHLLGVIHQASSSYIIATVWWFNNNQLSIKDQPRILQGSLIISCTLHSSIFKSEILASGDTTASNSEYTFKVLEDTVIPNLLVKNALQEYTQVSIYTSSITREIHKCSYGALLVFRFLISIYRVLDGSYISSQGLFNYWYIRTMINTQFLREKILLENSLIGEIIFL